MLFPSLSKANTFSQWITTQQKVVSVLNKLTDSDGTEIFYSNTNLNIANNVHVGGNVLVTGFVTINQEYDYDVEIAGLASITKQINAGIGNFANLDVSGNVVALNVTNTLDIGTDATVYGTLSVSEKFTTNNLNVVNGYQATNLYVPNLNISENVEQVNLTTTLFIGTDSEVYGNLNVFGNTTLSNYTTIEYGNFETVNVYSLQGQANTNIYNNIFASSVYTSTANLLAEYATLSCILG